jgi:hypothetical protein
MFDDPMHVAVGRAARPQNTLGVVAVVCGVVGASITGLLWLYQLRPTSPLLGDYGYEIAYGGQLREDLILLAGLLGAVAVAAAVLSSVGGRAKPSAMAAMLLGAIALTLPVMTWLDLTSPPLRIALFPGS